MLFRLLFIFAAIFLLACSKVPEYDVCGSNEYIVESEFCSNGAIYEKCGSKAYEPKSQFCSEQEDNVYEKCGNSAYNTATQSCCAGTNVYASSTQICENGSVKTLSSSSSAPPASSSSAPSFCAFPNGTCSETLSEANCIHEGGEFNTGSCNPSSYPYCFYEHSTYIRYLCYAIGGSTVPSKANCATRDRYKFANSDYCEKNTTQGYFFDKPSSSSSGISSSSSSSSVPSYCAFPNGTCNETMSEATCANEGGNFSIGSCNPSSYPYCFYYGYYGTSRYFLCYAIGGSTVPSKANCATRDRYKFANSDYCEKNTTQGYFFDKPSSSSVSSSSSYSSDFSYTSLDGGYWISDPPIEDRFYFDAYARTGYNDWFIIPYDGSWEGCNFTYTATANSISLTYTSYYHYDGYENQIENTTSTSKIESICGTSPRTFSYTRASDGSYITIPSMLGIYYFTTP